MEGRVENVIEAALQWSVPGIAIWIAVTAMTRAVASVAAHALGMARPADGTYAGSHAQFARGGGMVCRMAADAASRQGEDLISPKCRAAR
jgi:hypothetical protein